MTLEPAQRRRLEQREQVRRTILAAAEGLLVAEGYERFSMRRLAERCGYTVPTIYHHFGDKLRLVDALIEERFAEVLRHLKTVPTSDDPLVTLSRLGHEFVAFVRRNPTHYRILMLPRGEQLVDPPSAKEAIAMVQRPLHELQAAGRLLVRDSEAAFQAIWATLHGVLHLRIARPEYPWTDDVERLALEAMSRGLVRQADTP